MSEWREFPDRDSLDRSLSAHLAQCLGADIASRGAASLAVSGGSTPKGLFAQLAGSGLDWARIWITLVDERWVAPDHPDSNERLVRENLLRGPAASAHFFGLKSDAPTAADGLARTTERLRALPLPLSCAVLGMGSDGHTASWFPQSSNLPELLDPEGTALLGATDPVTAPHERITLTLPAVLNSRGVVIHITGEDKRTVLHSARERGFPVAAILEQQTTPVTIWWAP